MTVDPISQIAHETRAFEALPAGATTQSYAG